VTLESALTIEVTFRAPDSWRAQRLRVRAPDYASWCGAISGALVGLVGADAGGLLVHGLLAEQSTKPPSRVRAYRGFSFYYLDEPADGRALGRPLYDRAEGSFAVDERTEFLFAILSAPPSGGAEVARLALNWASSTLILLPRALSLEQAKRAIGHALRVDREGGATAVRWSRSALHAAIPEAGATVGLSGPNVGSSLAYEALIAAPAVERFPEALDARLPVQSLGSP
jgi:hypothetical protein